MRKELKEIKKKLTDNGWTLSVSAKDGDLGYWIEERNDYGELTGYHCSNCYEDTGFTTDCAWAFCPECGKRMERIPHEI